MSPLLTAILAFLLSSFSIAGLASAALYPRLSGARRFRQRFEGIAELQKEVDAAASSDSGGRKKSIEATLRELEEKQKAKTKRSRRHSLTERIRQAGLGWSKNSYYAVSLACAAASFAFLLLLGISTLPALGFGIATGLLLPHAYVSAKRKSRFKRFSAEFANAVDVMVRGLKAGLPATDCMKVIALEAQEPVRSEFKAITADQTLGLTVDEAVQRLPDRIPLPEARFFAIVITIQSRTGGSLSEALSNLSRVLRERKKMHAKIKAMSAEAKASGGIIGMLPVIVAGLVYLTSPDYISLLFTTLAGNIVLVGCALWMGIGVLVMRKMINFDF
jgi:tight adherence protein B